MNRRELFQNITAAVAAAGLPAGGSAITTIDSASAPVLGIVEVDHPISVAAAANIRAQLKQVVEGTPLQGVKWLIVEDGMRLNFVDAGGRVVNQTLGEG